MDFWYTSNLLSYLLVPFSFLFRFVVALRCWLYRIGVFKVTDFPVPVVVVGNLTVGGTGKTPLVMALVDHFRAQGYQPGIVSRGYGGQGATYPAVVGPDSDPAKVGDEAVLMAQKTGCPVVVSPDRVAAVQKLLADTETDLVLSDDGLQHYALGRSLEICVVDGERRWGNGWCLPAGPLREPLGRLASIDFVVSNGSAASGEYPMQLLFDVPYQVNAPEMKRPLDQFKGERVHAVAGIGNPDRFFDQLRAAGLDIIVHPFADHHAYQASDLQFDSTSLVLMTEKDAIKCQRWADTRCWCLPVRVVLSVELEQSLRC